MREWNNLSITAYGTSTTPIVDPKQELLKAESIQFRTQYPGGLYADASFYVPRHIIDWWELQGATRIVFKNDTRQVYEGYISNFQRQVSDDGQGVLVRTIGAWGKILMNWNIQKYWADDRISEDAWVWQTGGAEDKCTLNRTEQIKFTPKGVAWNQYESAGVRYTMPTGETVKRVTYDYTLISSSAATTWRIGLYDPVGTAWLEYVDRTTAGTTTGSADYTLVTPRNYVELLFQSRNASPQTPVEDGSVSGNITNLIAYSETSSINMKEIAMDVVGIVTDMNSETRFISTADSALTLVPFISNFETAADIINRAASQGDGAYNRWAPYIIGSENAFVPDGKPLLVLSQYPALTDYDYAVSLSDLGDNLLAPFTISEDYDSIANWIAVRYTDINGIARYRSPADNSDLRDDTSIAAYGRRAMTISVPGTSTQVIADSIGKRYLATYKSPQFRLTTPITVKGYIRGKGGNRYPASEIRSQQRVRVEDFSSTAIGGTQGLTFVVTQTAYDNDGETCSLVTGEPNAPIMQRFTPRKLLQNDLPEQIQTPAQPVVRSVTDEMLAAMGYTRAEWAKLTPKQRRAAKRAAGF